MDIVNNLENLTRKLNETSDTIRRKKKKINTLQVQVNKVKKEIFLTKKDIEELKNLKNQYKNAILNLNNQMELNLNNSMELN